MTDQPLSAAKGRRKVVLGIALATLLVAVLGGLLWPRGKESVIRIMPLGDSITQGTVERDSYRRPLWQMLRDEGAKVDFVGSLTLSYPAGEPRHTDFDTDHEAHWGWRVDDVLRRLDDWARQYMPDIVLVHLGTNDIIQKKDVQETVENLRQVVLTLRRHNPKVKVFLAQIIPAATTAANEEIKKLNQRLPEMAQSVNTAESPVILVNHAEGFDPWKDTYDGIHPNEAGVDKMAQKWFEALLILPEIRGKPVK